MKIVYSILRPIARRYPWLAKLFRDIRFAKSLLEEPAQSPLGFNFFGNSAMKSGNFEKAEVEIIQEFLKNTDVFINVGANVGYYCCIALMQHVKTIAFEPIDMNLKCLYKNILSNGWQNDVEIYPLALSNKTGLIEIYGGGTSASLVKGWANAPEYTRQWVPVSMLDNVIGSALNGQRCLILVDVEGAEYDMMRGSLKLFDMDPKPIWIIEITVKEHLPQGISVNPNLLATFEIFWQRGYQAFTCVRKSRCVQRSEIEQIIETSIDTIKTHNFIFKPNTSALHG